VSYGNQMNSSRRCGPCGVGGWELGRVTGGTVVSSARRRN